MTYLNQIPIYAHSSNSFSSESRLLSQYYVDILLFSYEVCYGNLSFYQQHSLRRATTMVNTSVPIPIRPSVSTYISAHAPAHHRQHQHRPSPVSSPVSAPASICPSPLPIINSDEETEPDFPIPPPPPTLSSSSFSFSFFSSATLSDASSSESSVSYPPSSNTAPCSIADIFATLSDSSSKTTPAVATAASASTYPSPAPPMPPPPPPPPLLFSSSQQQQQQQLFLAPLPDPGSLAASPTSAMFSHETRWRPFPFQQYPFSADLPQGFEGPPRVPHFRTLIRPSPSPPAAPSTHTFVNSGSSAFSEMSPSPPSSSSDNQNLLFSKKTLSAVSLSALAK